MKKFTWIILIFIAVAQSGCLKTNSEGQTLSDKEREIIGIGGDNSNTPELGDDPDVSIIDPSPEPIRFYYSEDEKRCLNRLGDEGLNIGIVECGDPEAKYIVDQLINNKKYPGISFFERQLENVDFSQSILRGSDFSYSKLDNVNFKSTDLTDANFEGAEISNSDLSELNLMEDLLERGITLGLNNILPPIIDEIDEVLDDDFDLADDDPLKIDDEDPDRDVASDEDSNSDEDSVSDDDSSDVAENTPDDIISEGERLRHLIGELSESMEQNRGVIRAEKKKVNQLKKDHKAKKKDLKSLKADVKKVKKSLKDLNAKKRAINKEMRTLRSAIKDAHDSQKSALRQKFKELKEKRILVSKAIDIEHVNKKKSVDAIMELKKEVKALIAQAKDQRTVVKELKKLQKKIRSDLKVAMKKLKKLRRKAKQVAEN